MSYVDDLVRIVGEENVKTDEIERLCYSRDLSVHEAVPDAIVFVKSAAEVSEVMRLAARDQIPVTPRGSGTSGVGGALAAKGGILLDLSRMNQILAIEREDGYVVVEPGVICNNLNAALAPTHFFPPDPASSVLASLGGMVSTNASGNRALKYGTTKNYVLGLEVVLPDGRIIHTGSILSKTSAGYDLTQLFTQAEGTLGVITKIILKILPAPEYIAFAEARFRSTLDAAGTAQEILTSGIALSSCEILDKFSIEAVKTSMGLEIPEEVECILFIEVDGNKQAVQESIEKIDRISRSHKGIENKWDDDPAKRLKMWAARQGIIAALSKMKRGSRLQSIIEDFGVPITKITDTITEIQKVAERHRFPISTFGHIGDGNLHAVLMADPRNKEEWEKIKRVTEDLIDLTLRFRGTLTAEHGTGMAKSPYIQRELGTTLEVMKEIKQVLDPKNILNPGKMGFDDSIRDIYDNFAFRPLVEDPARLTSFGKRLDDEIMACMMCGFCRNGCPVYRESSLESTNARGRVILAYHLLTGRLEPSAALAEKFYRCTTCLNCKAVCPAGILVSDIVEGARERLVASGFLPAVHGKLIENLRTGGNPLGEPQEKRTDVFPSNFTAARPGSDILLFLGCVTSYQDINIVPSTMAILDSAGVSYTALGKEEHCCGYISYLTGTDDFKAIAEKNRLAFSKMMPQKIVATCAGCFKTFKELYPKYTSFNMEVVHAVEYLNDLVQQGKIRFGEGQPVKVAYHDPCDLGRHLNIFEPPRDLLRKIPGVTLVEFKNNRLLAKCCGGGGGLKAFDTALSGDIAYKRMLEALEVGAETVVSACPSCKANLQLAAARLRREKKGRIKVMDITEMVAAAIKETDA